MDIQDEVDRVLREGVRVKNRAECRVIEIGRTAHNPRRRQAPLHDSYDAVTSWAVVVGFAGAAAIGLWCVAVGFAQTVLWLERLVRS